MPFLYEKIDTLREVGVTKELPQYIPDNLNPNFELRPYQITAFENFITYFENGKLCQKPTQTLFHMATGSGKTLIMAGLMLYLYKQGYRNFLFFVNLDNIVQKTKENFLNSTSSKYLFGDEIVIDGEKIKIKEVANFQYSDDTAINICFTTTQGLHSDMWGAKENSLSVDDFSNQKVALISDEAHHLNADTKKMNKEEEESYKSWEYTVHSIFCANRDNVLLEFTATCDIKNPLIKAEYENKIVFDYPLYKFRSDKYSKEIKTLCSDLNVEERALQALVLSQYRYKVFQDYRQNIKPVVFFQSRLVKENARNMAKIIDIVQSLSGERIKNLFEQSTSETLAEAHKYFIKNGISYDELASELKDDFSEQHCISANDNQDVENKQIILNSLEDESNPSRAVFAVDKLNEGWDVLNLFDIVRLYETRDGKNGIPGKTTIKEAQLIGRGARYCPFKITDEQEKYRRKYDSDIDNPLRICEELYYHCWNEPRYISELHAALRETGIDLDRTVTIDYILKEEFKQDDLYKNGLVFTNERLLKSRNEVVGLLPSVRDKIYNVSLATGRSGEDVIMEDNLSQDNNPDNLHYEQFQDGTVKCIEDEIPFDIPESWAWERLGNISLIARGGSPRPIKSYLTNDENGINWIKIGDTEIDGKYIYSTKEKIKPEGASKSRYVKSGDFLLTNSMSFGRPYILKTDGCIHDGWLVIGNIEFVFYQDYLYYALSANFMYNALAVLAGGSTVDNLNSDLVKALLFPIPPMNEQIHIASKVENLLNLIVKINEDKEIITKDIKDVKSKILDLAIRGKLVPQDPNDEPASVLLECIQAEKEELIKQGKIKRDKKESVIFKGEHNSYYEKIGDSITCIDDELPFEIPSSWTWCRLGEIFSHNTGKALNSSNTTGCLMTYITTSNLYWDRFVLDSLKKMRFSENEIEKCTVRKGDLLVCEGGDIGRAAIWMFDEEIRIQNHIHKLRPYTESSVSNRFFYYVFYLWKQMDRIGGRGIGLQGFSSKVLHNLLIPLLPFKEQLSIVSKIDCLFSVLEGVEKSLS